MLLEILLIILILILLVFGISIRFWWKKYGVTMFNTMNELKSFKPKNMNSPIDLNNMISDFNKIMGKLK